MKILLVAILIAAGASELVAANPSAALGKPGSVLLEDSFAAPSQKDRRPTRGPWKFVDGVASCVQNDELYKKFKDHGPALWQDFNFTDAIIEFEVRTSGSKTFVFTVNGKDGHVFRFVTGKGRTGVRTWPAGDTEHKSIGTAAGKTGIENLNQWTKVVVELKGEKAAVTIGGERLVASHPTYAAPKIVVGLGFSFGEASFRGFRVRELK